MPFESWKIEAEKQFPELCDEVNNSDTPYILWFKLRDLFFNAYERGDEVLIKRIYEYADWCIQQPEGATAADDLATCVSVCFFEHIPESKLARDDMPRWFTLSDFRAMEATFKSHLSPKDFEDLRLRFQSASKT